MNEKIYNLLNNLADEAGCPVDKESYNEIRESIQNNDVKQYAVLGDVNSGKSTIINILAGEKKLSATMLTNEHDKIVVIASPEHKCRWVELNSQAYLSTEMEDTASPLWHIDAAVYLISATSPFSRLDVDSIKACVAHGVPCSLILTKLDLIDASEREEVIAYTKSQAEYHFGDDSLLIINTKAEAETRQTVIEELLSSEDSLDIREYMLALSYAKSLKSKIFVKYERAKDELEAANEKERKDTQSIREEKLAWEKIELDIEKCKRKLIEDMSVEMNHLYSECVVNLTNKAIAASSPKVWWEKSLKNEFRLEIFRISKRIDSLICHRVAADRDWLIKAVEQRFGTKLMVDSKNEEAKLGDVVFGIAPESLSKTRVTKTVAAVGLVVSAVALCGILAYPILTMHSINSLCWKLASVAVAGSGFWTYFETKKEKAERQQCLRMEIARYVLGSRDENIDALKKNIVYGYENMRLSLRELQLASRKVPTNDSKAFATFKAISETNRKCDEIINSMLSDAE